MIAQLFTTTNHNRTARMAFATGSLLLAFSSGTQAIEPKSIPEITFKMPKEPVYGFISIPHEGYTYSRQATGTFILGVFEKIEFKANPVLSTNPEVLDQLPYNNVITIELDFCKLGDKELRLVSNFPNLSRLALKSTNITDSFLATASNLANLNELDISHTKVTGSGLVHLAKLKKLKTLKINSNKIDPDKFTQIDKLKNLTELNVRHTGLTDGSMAAIGKLKNIQALKLGENQSLSDSGITKLKSLKQLRLLEVTGTKITPRAIAAMRFPKLLMIAISHQQLSKNGLAILYKAYPDIAICPGDLD